jgi:glycosyltransferase involved in cell wall biosynthesis
MDREINYSIIIPHKNIPELLQRCLNSILQANAQILQLLLKIWRK